jgi:hypothetical protein
MIKKLKIAVYINGQWRGSSFKCSEFLKPYFEQFDVDYYIHTCDYYFGKNIKLDFSKNESKYNFLEISEVFHSKEDIENIRNTYKNVVYFHVDDKKKNEEITNLKGKKTSLEMKLRTNKRLDDEYISLLKLKENEAKSKIYNDIFDFKLQLKFI